MLKSQNKINNKCKIKNQVCRPRAPSAGDPPGGRRGEKKGIFFEEAVLTKAGGRAAAGHIRGAGAAGKERSIRVYLNRFCCSTISIAAGQESELCYSYSSVPPGP